MNVSGKWEGKLLDASGSVARVKAELKQSESRISGEFSVYMRSARGGCDPGDWSLALSAPVSGSYSTRGDKVRLKYSLKIGDTPIDVAFQGQATKADPHARRAVLGSYSTSDEGGRIGFEGGACILWLYRN